VLYVGLIGESIVTEDDSLISTSCVVLMPQTFIGPKVVRCLLFVYLQVTFKDMCNFLKSSWKILSVIRKIYIVFLSTGINS